MAIDSKGEILEILRLPEAEFRAGVMERARRIHREHNGGALTASAMLGCDNVCKNQCLYCGMRAGNREIQRYRIPPAEVLQLADNAREMSLTRLFLVAGEDPGYGFDNLLSLVRGAAERGLRVSLAAGEFSREEYRLLKEAGVEEYVLKFEMSDRETFNRLNPSTTFERRMACIEAIRDCGMLLGSGNIVGYPGQTLEQLADDILLMKKLEIHWAPIIPFMPAAGTPLADEGGRGSLDWNRREIAILRCMMPAIDITAQQPGENPAEGLAGAEGNLAALSAGANLLFVDLLPAALAKNFRVIDHRLIQGLDHIRDMAARMDMPLVL